MKKTILSLAILFSTIAIYAQGTLQFNQVKLVTTSETVPAGKVWKVVSVIASSNLAISDGIGTASRSTQISINGVTNYINQISSWVGPNSGSNANPRPYGMTSSEITQLPIWLPATTTLAAGTNTSAISVIEFNIIP